MNEFNDKPIEELDLSIRTFNVMKRADIKTIGDIVSNESKLRAKAPKALDEALVRIEALKGTASDGTQSPSSFWDIFLHHYPKAKELTDYQVDHFMINECVKDFFDFENSNNCDGGIDTLAPCHDCWMSECKCEYTGYKHSDKFDETLESYLKYKDFSSKASDLIDAFLEGDKISNITYIDVKKIDPHPNNPRKDIGDVTELADSIKQNGIMQNLTVVPWFSAATGEPADDNSMDGYYRALIGHRRLAAAKKLGLEKVPCVIAENLSLKDQVAIMLAENMQRADLTEYEQAEGIQLMLDLGDTISEVSQKTGLSESTVRRRTKIMKYDRKDVKESFDRGATLADYEKLEGVSDPDKRAELIKSIGTNNFDWKVSSAINDEKRKIYNDKVLEMLSKVAKKIKKVDYSKLDWCQSWRYRNDDNLDVEEIKNFRKTRKYFYTVPHQGYDSFNLYVEKTGKSKNGKTPEISAEEKERAECVARLSAIASQMEKRRIQFIKDFTAFPCKKTTEILETMYEINRLSMKRHCIGYMIFHYKDMAELLGYDPNDYKEQHPDLPYESQRMLKMLEDSKTTGLQQFVYYNFLILNTSNKPYYGEGAFRRDDDLANLYDFLKLCGYVLSDEEQAILDGTHEAYAKGK